MTQDEYYIAPLDRVFYEIKAAACLIWQQYDDTYGYATEKLDRIEDLKNEQDNAWFIVSLFDPDNQKKLLAMVSPETQELIKDARGY